MSEPIHAESDGPKASKPEPMQAEGSGVLEPVNMLELTSVLASAEPTIVPKLPISEPSQVEVQQAEAMVTEPMDTEPTISGSLPEKLVFEEKMLEQLSSISVAESTEAMAVEPMEPTPQEQEVAHSKPKLSITKVQASTLRERMLGQISAS